MVKVDEQVRQQRTTSGARQDLRKESFQGAAQPVSDRAAAQGLDVLSPASSKHVLELVRKADFNEHGIATLPLAEGNLVLRRGTNPSGEPMLDLDFTPQGRMAGSFVSFTVHLPTRRVESAGFSDGIPQELLDLNALLTSLRPGSGAVPHTSPLADAAFAAPAQLRESTQRITKRR